MKIVFATNNPNKFSELKDLLPKNITLLNLHDIHCYEDLPETQITLEGNSKQKAQFIFDKYALPCLADDTGLEITALNNEPGVYSARYAGEKCNAEDNMLKVLKNMENNPQREARFRTVFTLIIDSKNYQFEGVCKGRITNEKQGNKGFGYDPIFMPEGHQKTFAQMTKEEKNAVSHRGLATQKLISFLFSNYTSS